MNKYQQINPFEGYSFDSNISSKIIDVINKSCNEEDQKDISILIHGLDHFEDFLLPIFENKTDDFQYDIYLAKNIYASEDHITSLKNNNSTNNGINIFQFDWDKSTLQSEGVEKVDVIISLFTIHHFINWRQELVKLLKNLKKGGSFFFTEVGGSFQYLDFNFKAKKVAKPDKPDLVKILEQIARKRSENSFHWDPEIRMSDYQPLYNELTKLFSDAECEHEFLSKPVNVNKEYLEEIFTNQVLSSIYFGFEKGKYTEELQGLGDNSYNLDLETKLFVFKDYHGSGHLEKVKWGSDILGKKLLGVHQSDSTTLNRAAFDLICTHDVFFRDETIFIGLFGWSDINKARKFPIHIATNILSSETHKKTTEAGIESILNYLFLKKRFDFTVNERLFKNFNEKFQITFWEVNTLGDDINKCNILDNSKELKLGFKYKFSSKGVPEKLDLFLDKNLRSAIEKLFLYELVKFDEKGFSKFEDKDYIKKLDLDKGREISRLSISEKVFEDSDLKKYSKSFTKSYNATESQYKDLDKILKPIISRNSNDNDTMSKAKKDFFIAIIKMYHTFLAHQENNCKLTVIPSSTLEENGRVKGLGGVMLLEKNTINDSIPKSIIEYRDRTIEQAGNIIYHKTYVTNDYLGQSLKAAIAAIIARNGSHGIGSHVLPNVAHTYSNPTDNQQLFSYIEQRLDFIAQTATEFPVWSFPSWFNSDLMMRFFIQRQLLNTLVKSEGIEAYEFNLENAEEHNWFKWKQESFKSKKGDRVIIHGFIKEYDKEKGTIKLIQHHENSRVLKSEKHTNEDNTITCKIYDWQNKAIKEILHDSSLRIDDSITIKGKQIEPNSKDDNGITIEGKQVRLIGNLNYENGDDQLKKPTFSNCELIEHKLVIKVRKRTFLDSNYKAETSGNIYSKYKHLAKDLGKLDDLDSLKGVTGIFYGVISHIEPSGEVLNSFHLLSLENEQNQIECMFSKGLEYFGKQKPWLLHLKLGVRVIVKGIIKQKTSNEFYIDNVELLEIVKINYIVGETFIKQNSQDKLRMDMPVAIPGGVVGYQAFYTILENIIRNAAKHDWVRSSKLDKLGKNLEVKIELEEKENKPYIICKIWTDASNLFVEGKENYREVLLSDITGLNISTETPLHRKLNQYFKEPIIEDNGKLKRKNLGLAETKIAAGYLNNQDIKVIGGLGDEVLLGGIEKEEQGFIKASSVWEMSNNKLIPRLGFKIKLLKPKELLILYPQSYYSIQDIQQKLLHNKEDISSFGITLSTYGDDRDKLEALDYEFCLLYIPTDMSYSKNILVNTILELLRHYNDGNQEHNLNKQKLKETKQIFLNELTKYPFRLFCIYEDAKETFFPKQLSKELSEHLLILKSRVRFLSIEEIKESDYKNVYRQSKEENKSKLSDAECFKLFLYDQWLKIYTKAGYKYPLTIELGVGPDYKENKLIGKTINSGTYSIFKHNIIQTFAEEITHEGEEKVEQVKRFLKQQKPERQNFTSQNILLQNWLFENAEYKKKYLNKLEDVFSRYKKIYKQLFDKRLVEIETLPPIYTPKSKKVDSHKLTNFESQIGKPNDWAFISDDNNPKSTKPIAYIRHDTGHKSNNIYLDYLSGNQMFFSILKENPSPITKSFAYNKLIRQLIENAMPVYMIIDERVQDYVEEMDYRTRLSNLNIIIPDSVSVESAKEPKQLLGKKIKEDNIEKIEIQIKVKQTNGENESNLLIQFKQPENVEKRKNALNTTYYNNISVLIIHNAVLEQVFSLGKDADHLSFKDKVNRFIYRLKLDHIPCILITSGKGKPEGMSDYAKFIPFSNIESFILQPYPEKFLLSQILLKTINKR